VEVPRFRPVDLDRHPAVDALLVELGLGRFVRESLSAPVGRNDSWAGATESGRQVIVKRLVGPPADVRSRLDRLLGFERFVAGSPALAAYAPPFLGVDRAAGLVAYEYLDGARNGAVLIVDDEFPAELAESVGRAVGQLHGANPVDTDYLDDSLPPLPRTSLLEGLPLPMFNQLSAGEMQAWRLMQQDPELITGLVEMGKRELAAPKVPSHCDFRVDQLLVSGDRIYITDWEEFRLADPARDVGSFAGEWLHRSVLDIVTSRGDGDAQFVDLELTHEQVLRRGAEKLERLLPRFHHFYRGYRSERPDLDGGFAERVTAYAGWHLLDRLLAGARHSQRLSGIERAAAGIGRKTVLSPEKFAPVLNLDEEIS
jgi:hypothetical protein